MRRIVLAGAVLTPFNYLIALPLGPITLHPLQVWALALIMFTLALKPGVIRQAADSPALLIWTMFAFVVMSTLVGTPAEYRMRGYLDVSLLAINLAAFTLVCGHLRSNTTSWMLFGRVLFTTSLVSSGILVARSFLVAHSAQLFRPDSYVLGLGTVTGTFTAAFAAASVAGVIFATTVRLRILMILGVILHGLAACLSLARGPWLAFGFAVVATFVLMVRRLPSITAVVGALQRSVAALLLLGLVATTAVVANANVARLIASRLLQVVNIGTGTGFARLTLFRTLLEDSMDSPLYGHGAASYRRVSELLYAQGSISENFLLEMFHAGGAMAALPLLIAAAIVITRLLRALGDRAQDGQGAVCLAGVLSLMLGALSNPAAWDTAFWVLLSAAAALSPLAFAPRTAVARGYSLMK